MASADSTSTLDIDKALDVASRRMGYERLFPKQREAVEAFISGRDVFVCLPTGYRKSFCYGCLPIVFDCLRGQTSSIVVVVTPLVAIMKEKALNFEKKGLTAVYITGRSNDVTCCCTVQHSPVTGYCLTATR